jgi:transposase
MSGPTRRRKFDAQFKLDAVRLIQSSDRSISDIARDLGVRRELLYKWNRELEADPKNAFPGKGKRKPDQERLYQLEQELKRAKEERDILKKALAFFSKNAE